MNRTQFYLRVSLGLNLLLVLMLACREVTSRFVWQLRDMQVSALANYAGSMQAHADFGNGVRRIYRATLTSPADDRGLTGDREGETEVWQWPYYENWLGGTRIEAEAYTEAYNGRMREYMRAPDSYKPHGLSGTRSSD